MQGPTGLYELFLLTVPTEEVAHWEIWTVPIRFPLNLQTIHHRFWCCQMEGRGSGASRISRWGIAPPLPFLLLSFLSFASPPSFPLEVGPLKSSYGVWGSAVSSPSGVWGEAPAEIEFGAF